MSWILLLRIVPILCIVVSGASLLLLMNILPVSQEKRLFCKTRIISSYCKLILKILGIRLTVIRHEQYDKKQNYLILSNHLSYVDIFLIASFIPAVFVTSFDIKKFFLPGFVAQLGGSLFVERKSIAGLKREIWNVADTLKKGFHVVLFPETTSTNGERVLPFKSALIESVFEVRKPIIPLCLKYRRVNDEPVVFKNRNMVFWYGNMGFFPHLVKLMSLRSIQVELVVLEKIEVKDHTTRKEISEQAYQKISRCYEDGKVSK
jgi:1-acyl-sn-glycerol-3-phosphate acyltransferase